MQRSRSASFALLLMPVAGLNLAPASTIEQHSLFSDTLGRVMEYNILLPDGYETGTGRYPALFLFRGHVREWLNPTEDGSRRGTIQTVYDALSGQGLVGQMIIVMPGLSAPASGAEFGYVLHELIPHIDSRFRTVPIRNRRGVDGFSYGGYDMLELLWRRPTEFITAGAYDGSFWAFDLDTLAAAPESFWRNLRAMRFLLHAAAPGVGNHGSSQMFLSILESNGVYNSFDTLALTPSAVHNWFHADMHMERALPLHWAELTSNRLDLPVALHSPVAGTTVSGDVPLAWSVGDLPAHVIAEFSSDGGSTWNVILDTLSSDSTATWATLSLEDGTRYLVRVRVATDSLYGYAETIGTFALDNPGNGAPDIVLLSPLPGESLSGEVNVRWEAADPEGDPLSITIETSPDDGASWLALATSPNTGSYALETRLLANSPLSRLRLKASDGQASRETVSGVLSILNIRPTLSDTLVQHTEGIADGNVSVRVIDPGSLTGHRYGVRFHASVPKTFSVQDLTLSTTVLDAQPIPPDGGETELVDGMRFVLEDFDPARVSKDSTGWVVGTSTLNPQVDVPTLDPGTGPITGTPYPADYNLTVFGETVDTSASVFGWSPTPVNFTVWNVTEGHQVEVLVADLDGDQRLGRFDIVVLLEADTAGEPILCWELFFSGDDASTPPAAGDVFRLKVLKPFTSNDTYEFTADPAGVVSVAPGERPAAFMLDQNFPNPFNPSTTISYRIPERGLVRLEVFDLLGRRVAIVIDEMQDAGRHSVVFRADHLASGMYVYRLTASGAAGAGKMLLVR